MENDLSKSVKILCKQQGIPMRELAERMQIAPESLSRAINGNPQLSTIRKIAECLRVDVADLFSPAPDSTGAMSLVEHQSQRFYENNPPQIINNELVAMVRFRNQTLATSDLPTLIEFINTIAKIKQKIEEDFEEV